MMEDLGFLKLDRIDVPFSSLTSSPTGLIFAEDLTDDIPDSTIYARLCRRSPSDFYEHTRLTNSEFLLLYQELRPIIARPRQDDFSSSIDPLHLSRFSHRKLHPID